MASINQTLVCSHGVGWQDDCKACEDEDERARAEELALRKLCGDVAGALDDTDTHYPTAELHAVCEGMTESACGDAEECCLALREVLGVWPEALYVLPTDLQRRVRAALGIQAPLAHLAVGQERLDDVAADARTLGVVGRAFVRAMKDPESTPHVLLCEIISIAKGRPDPTNMVLAGLAWRAYRVWRAEQVRAQRARDDEEIACASGEHLRSVATLNGVPVCWPPEDDDTLRAKVRDARAGRVQP